MHINMHDLSLAQQSFGGKCGLMSAKSRQTRPTFISLAEPHTLAGHWLENSLQEPSLTAFPNPY